MAKILCIEDEEDIRDLLVEELSDAGYDVFEAVNGTTGLAAIEKHHPDLVLCDINMPEMSGQELLHKLRDDYPKFADIPFIFLTAFADREHIQAGLETGADDYLTKPVDFEMLLPKIAAQIRQVDRMKQKKTDEHVKLYKALSKEFGPESAAASQGNGTEDETASTNETPYNIFETDRAQIFTLDEFKEHYGDQWARVSHKVKAITESVIKGNIGPGDVYGAYGPDGYAFVFKEHNADEAAARLACIVEQLRRKLFGESADNIGKNAQETV